uniref:Uncharacterized protein LOC100177107 n=1 Tax=Phallusia mammillata TaxID=59560 RepID=A0A6F9DGU5_9ASCI|nr:uncharacterized protein LOC100177107 [Phallusia mammillata]
MVVLHQALVVLTLLLCKGLAFEKVFDTNIPGHMEPLGSHAHPSQVETRWTVPTPEEFYRLYTSASKPVVLKGAATRFPAYRLWTDSYLRNYGNWKVVVEEGKKEDRSKPTYTMSMNEFLDTYKARDVYLVHDLVPPNPMTEEVLLPKPITCGGFQHNIQSVVLWFSSGGTESTFHAEQVDNLECMFDGWKEYLLISKKDGETILDEDEGKYQEMDVEKVDMTIFPEIAQLPWYKLHVEPGDCFFVPQGWLHFVNSSKTRNMAISFWLTHQYRVVDDCHRPDQRKEVLSQITISDAGESSRVAFLDLFFGKPNMTLPVFLKFFSTEEAKQEETENMQANQSRESLMQRWMEIHKSKNSLKTFQQIDKNGDNLLSVDEVYNAPLVFFEKLIGGLGEEYAKYETVGDDEGKSGEDILKERKRMFLRNEL